MAFTGTYTVVKEENFVSHLIKEGIPADKISNATDFVVEIKQDGKNVTIIENFGGGKQRTITFADGAEFDEIVSESLKIKSTAKLEGNSITLSSSNGRTRIFTVTATGLEIVHKSSSGEGKLILKKA